MVTLIQRFSLLVWPDQSGECKEVDRYPDSDARKAAWGTFDRLNDLNPESMGAERDDYEIIPFLRFDKAVLDDPIPPPVRSCSCPLSGHERKTYDHQEYFSVWTRVGGLV